MEHLTFPVLAVQEIITDLSSVFRITDITEQDFNAPNRAKWQEVYMLLLAHITGNSVNSIRFNFNVQVANVELSDLHRSGIEMALLTRHLGGCLRHMGIDNFSMKDILNPTKKRLIRVLSAVLNYLHFRNERIVECEGVKQIIRNRSERQQCLVAERDIVVQQINEIKRVQAEQEGKSASVREKRDALFAQLVDEKNSSEALEHVTNDNKSKTIAVTSELAQCEEGIQLLMVESERLESMIVQSPERASKEKETMLSKLASMKQMVKEKLERLRSLNQASSIERSNECEQASKLLNVIEEHQSQIRLLMNEKKRKMDEQQLLNAQIADINSQLQGVERQIHARLERLDKQELQQRIREDAIKQEFQELHIAKDQQCIGFDSYQATEDEIKQALTNLHIQREEFRQRREKQLADRAHLVATVEKYNAEMATIFERMCYIKY